MSWTDPELHGINEKLKHLRLSGYFTAQRGDSVFPQLCAAVLRSQGTLEEQAPLISK